MATNRARILEQIVRPNAGDPNLARQRQESQAIRMQAAVGQAPTTLGTRAAQQLGAEQVAQTGKINLQEQQATQEQAQAAAQTELAGAQREAQSRVFGLKLALGKQQQKLSDQLAGLSERAKTLLLDEQLAFEKDRAGNLIWKDRQLADYAIMSAKSEEDLLNKAQMIQQASKRKIQLLETAKNRIQQSLQSGYIRDKLIKDRSLEMELKRQAQAIDLSIKKEQAKANNRMQMFRAGGTIAGTILGAAVGGPAGAVVGSQIGAGVGSVAGGTQ